MLCLKKVIEYGVGSIKEHSIIFIGSKIGLNHLAISVLVAAL
jgi:hypothetical protein